jgi:outer membrane lipoprotein-sorting protein
MSGIQLIVRGIPALRPFALIASFAFLIASQSLAGAETPEEFLDKYEAKTRKLKSYEIVSETESGSSYSTSTSTVTTATKRTPEGVKFATVTELTTTTQFVPGAQQSSLKVISDGKIVWTEAVAGGQTTVTKAKAPPEPTGYETVRESLKKGARASILPPQTIDGEECGVLQVIVGDGNSAFHYTYWVSDKTGLLVKLEGKSNAYGTVSTTVKSLKVDEPVDDSHFVYTPPANAQVFDSTATSAAPPIGSK